ncbi:hypothetical protein CVT25_008842 [Psilocybe cyanescens]|uniref:Uncharacterized protein n=1 Tax=Psilocybe cyanescens TaxID=93625 RepID=A0A409XAH2_PSICY|nr:hypothetical protein CVT25_008842 [Psilocybe cyanescens]
MYKELTRVIPTAAAFSCAILGLLSVMADFLLRLGFLMTVSIIYNHWKIGMHESGRPRMAVFGDLL